MCLLLIMRSHYLAYLPHHGMNLDTFSANNKFHFHVNKYQGTNQQGSIYPDQAHIQNKSQTGQYMR